MSWEVGSSAGLDVVYDAYVLLRKIREYPRDSADGYVLDSGAVDPAGSTGTALDDFSDAEGEVVYYALFARRTSDSLYYSVAVAYAQKTDLNFGDVSKSFFPQVWQKNRPMVDFTNPRAMREVLLDPAFGEVESLVKVLPRSMDVDECGPLALNGLGSYYKWPLSPLLDLVDSRDLLKELPALLRQKGQAAVSAYLLEAVSGLTCAVQQWKECQAVSSSFGGAENMRDYELLIVGVGDGINAAFSYVPSQDEFEPATVEVSDGTTEIVDDGDGNLVLESDMATPCGTCVYSGAGISIDAVFPSPPAAGTCVWLKYYYPSSSFDSEDPETVTRFGYLGDRAKRSFSVSPGASPASAAAYLYLEVEVGEEGVLTCSEREYLKMYVDDVKRKLEVFWPLFGSTRFVLTDRVVVSAPMDGILANLPLEERTPIEERAMRR